MINLSNIQAKKAMIPKKYHADIPTILELSKSSLSKDREVVNVISQLLKMINAELILPKTVKTKDAAKKVVTAKSNGQENTKEVKAKSSNLVLDYPIGQINTDEKRFQNRSQLDENTVNQIVKNFNPAKFDPVIVWREPSTKKVFVLAGHHRLQAMKILKQKTVQVKFLTGSEAEAITYAKVESNANRTLETEFERAKIYRKMRIDGKSKKQIQELAKETEGKNANGIVNLSYLKENGITIDALKSLDKADKQNKSSIEKIADWIGEAIKMYSEKLDYSHEKEMFDFLNNAELSKRIKSKQDFTQKITAIVGGFDFDGSEALNLKRLKYSSEGEKVYNSEKEEIEAKVKAILDKKTELKEQITALISSGKSEKEISDQMTAFEKLSVKANEDIKFYQSKLVELSRNKGKYTSAGQNQAALFGAKKKSKLNAPVQEQEPAEPTKPLVQLPAIPVQVNKYKTAVDRERENQEPKKLFNLKGDLAKFLGKIEIKPVQSLAITLDSGEGGGKTHTLYNWANEFFEAGYRPIIWSLEEHASSSLSTDKAEKYFGANKAYIPIESENENENSADTIKRMFESVKDFDVIMIDSWAKVMELDKTINFDQDLRKAFNGKLFIVVFQRTSSGEMRGGSKGGFDGDVILKVEVDRDDFRNNFIYNHKNRYNDHMPISELKYSPFHRALQKTEKEVLAEKPKLSFTAIEI